jgi:DNA-binding MarR family transcriptional regulator
MGAGWETAENEIGVYPPNPMETAPAPTLCVCASLRMATRIVARHYDHALAPASISTNDYSILVRLAAFGPLALGTLAGLLGMDRSTLSREVAPLVEAGLVEATADAADRRRRVLAVSAEGKARIRQARPLWEKAQADLSAGFGDGRTAALVGELNALAGAGQ